MQDKEITQVLYPDASPSGAYAGPVRGRRFTQSTPIMPEVWIAYGTDPEKAQKNGVLLVPHVDSSVRELVIALRKALAPLRRENNPERIFLAYNESHVIAHLTFPELMIAVLPLSVWWNDNIDGVDIRPWLHRLKEHPDMPELLLDPARQIEGLSPDVLDMIRVAGAVRLDEPLPQPRDQPPEPEYFQGLTEYFQRLLVALEKLFADFTPRQKLEEPPLWSVFSCRPVQSAVWQSRASVKADAAIRVFELSCKDIIWAVIDSGIDADHDAFLKWPAVNNRQSGDACPDGQPKPKPESRVLRSYDFTRMSQVLEAAFREDAMDRLKALVPGLDEEKQEDLKKRAADLGARLVSGQALDWALLEPLLRIYRGPDGRIPRPVNEHGTHVAGILAADWRKLRDADKPHDDYKEPDRNSIVGVCPDIRLYDLRVIKDDGTGDEFSVLSALQFIRHLNLNRDKMVVHGVNLSFSLPQLVKSFACGSSPVCLECERLVNSGVVVVTAAGNRGYVVANDNFEWYRSLSITDPGNADAVITVGSTHRTEPHRYGVSYFSSRGPTGDGRMKPDLVAPGEKIQSVVPGSTAAVALDGTSMAAPHVSGAAALLMARHRELMGRPRKVKEVLCASATDLGRERFFQGAGMLDVLRALQSV